IVYLLICSCRAIGRAGDALQSLLDTFAATTTRKHIAPIAWFSLLSLFLNGTRAPMNNRQDR
ncbi:MAG: hypothetical protein QOK09_957, partial [Mycobacterium sp.]|nr:hypothetical protein [Mycobacterium sp.]